MTWAGRVLLVRCSLQLTISTRLVCEQLAFRTGQAEGWDELKSLHHGGIILPLLHPILQLAQFFYVAADQNASHSAMEDTVLSAEFRREMELQGK